jgi:hypothetical protein
MRWSLRIFMRAAGARLDGRRNERAAQRDGRVVFRARGGDGEAKDVANRRAQLTGGFVRAAPLDFFQDGQDLPRRNFVDGSLAEPGKAKLINQSNFRSVAAAFPSRRFFSANSVATAEKVFAPFAALAVRSDIFPRRAFPYDGNRGDPARNSAGHRGRFEDDRRDRSAAMPRRS